jgi:Cyclin, N-terminal domain/Cyclin, C-terminal domain
MLKLTMNPRKRSKRNRSIPHRLRLPTNNRSSREYDEDEETVLREKLMLSDNLKVMLRQEASGNYSCTDYLSMNAWRPLNVYQLMKRPKIEHSSHPLAANTRVDEYCREQIVEWSFRVVDYFRIDREVVALSSSFLDRFLATCQCDRTSFKLAATTTLHLAVKLLYPCKLADLGILSDLSRGEFDMKDVCEMESHILRALHWQLHPPTAVAFASVFLDYFFASRVVHFSSTDLDDVYDVSAFFCELSVCEYSFVSMPASQVAIASILNALEGMFGPQNNIAGEIINAAREIQMTIVDYTSARNRLWELYERSEECALHSEKHELIEDNVWHSNIFVKKMSTNLSPVSVTKPCHSATDFFVSSHASKLRNESW